MTTSILRMGRLRAFVLTLLAALAKRYMLMERAMVYYWTGQRNYPRQMATVVICYYLWAMTLINWLLICILLVNVLLP